MKDLDDGRTSIGSINLTGIAKKKDVEQPKQDEIVNRLYSRRVVHNPDQQDKSKNDYDYEKNKEELTF